MRTARAEQDAKMTVDGDAAYFTLSIPSHSERLSHNKHYVETSAVQQTAADRTARPLSSHPHAPPTERERQCGAGCQLGRGALPPHAPPTERERQCGAGKAPPRGPVYGYDL